MNLLTIEEMLADLMCPSCSMQTLKWVTELELVVCDCCGRKFPTEQGIPVFILEEMLDEAGKGEIKGNMIDPNDEMTIILSICKMHDQPACLYQMEKTVDRIVKCIENGSGASRLFSIGSGSEFELQLLLKKLHFDRVYSSDISAPHTSLVPLTLSKFQGELGLFVSDFNHCPIKKSLNNISLVFHALHHAQDSHASLQCLLDKNFDRLVIVEPVTNWFVEILAFFGLAKRVEYSRIKPDWMRIRDIRRLVKDNYDLKVQTWWEPPTEVMDALLNVNKGRMWKPILNIIFFFSSVTNIFNFGCMALMHFEKKP